MIRSDGLSVRIGCGISISFQLAVDIQITELPADFFPSVSCIHERFSASTHLRFVNASCPAERS